MKRPFTPVVRSSLALARLALEKPQPEPVKELDRIVEGAHDQIEAMYETEGEEKP